MQEKDFQAKLIKTFNNQEKTFAKKFPDAIKGPWSRFIPKKPFDILVMHRGDGIGIECKQIKKWQDVSAGMLRASQIRGLREFKEAGGTSWVFLHVYIKGEKINTFVSFEYDEFISRVWEKEFLIEAIAKGPKRFKDVDYCAVTFLENFKSYAKVMDMKIKLGSKKVVKKKSKTWFP